MVCILLINNITMFINLSRRKYNKNAINFTIFLKLKYLMNIALKNLLLNYYETKNALKII